MTTIEAIGQVPASPGNDVESLLTDLSSEKASIRQAAVARLTGEPRSDCAPRIVEQLVALLRNDPNPNVRGKVAFGLWQFGQLAVDPLVAVMGNTGEAAFIRAHAARSLGRCKSGSAVDALAAMVVANDDLKVRDAAVYGLQQIATPAACDRLADALAHIGNDKLAARAVTALGQMDAGVSAGGAVDALLDAPVGPRTAAAAVSVLPRLLEHDALPRLAAVATHAQDEKLRKKAITQLGNFASPSSYVTLAECLLLDPSQEVRSCAAQSLSALPPARELLDQILRIGEENRLQPGDVDRTLLIKALQRAIAEGLPNGTTPAEVLIEQATSRSEPWPFLAALVLAVCGDTIRAGELVNEFQRRHAIAPDALLWLRIELGGSIALDPILQQLRTDLQTYFQKPVHKLNEATQGHWEKTLNDARWGFRIRMAMSVVVFIVGVALLVASSWQFLFGALDAEAAWGVGISFVGGLGSMLVVVYSGPLRDIREAVSDLGASNAIFIAYVHRVLEASHTFTALYMRERVTFDEADRAAQLIRNAMNDSVVALRQVSSRGQAGGG